MTHANTTEWTLYKDKLCEESKVVESIILNEKYADLAKHNAQLTEMMATVTAIHKDFARVIPDSSFVHHSSFRYDRVHRVFFSRASIWMLFQSSSILGSGDT